MNIIFCCITKRYLRLRHGSDLTWSRAISCLAVTFKNPWAAAFMISVATGVAYIAVPIWYVLLQKSVNPGAMATGAGFYNGTCYVLSSIAPVVLGWAAGIIDSQA
ncbi:MAG: hypothetical protein ACOX3D_03300 [Syntrophomonadales bacterium]